ncbi:MAG TPA: helix-turn-helix transcriptional regulator [Pyrinomonadaceae bacterium]|nr:helix-turn-helix transcriptional regulator [Pyrinomonadaceae bacterium]
MNKFGKEFRSERIAKRYTLKAVSDYVGKSISYLSDVEHGRKGIPDSNTIKLIEEFLGIKDSKLVNLANLLRKELPSNLIQEIQTRQSFSNVLARLADEDLTDEEFEKLNKELPKILNKVRGK